MDVNSGFGVCITVHSVLQVDVDSVGLECEEDMPGSDSEYSPPAGTESLHTHLRARESQLRESLGVPPQEPLPRDNPWPVSQSPPRDSQRGRVLWSAHGAEIIVASENTWYYPPKHLNILHGNETEASDRLSTNFFLHQLQPPTYSKPKQTTRVHIKVKHVKHV